MNLDQTVCCRQAWVVHGSQFVDTHGQGVAAFWLLARSIWPVPNQACFQPIALKEWNKLLETKLLTFAISTGNLGMTFPYCGTALAFGKTFSRRVVM